jgi:hypothetical protein
MLTLHVLLIATDEDRRGIKKCSLQFMIDNGVAAVTQIWLAAARIEGADCDYRG